MLSARKLLTNVIFSWSLKLKNSLTVKTDQKSTGINLVWRMYILTATLFFKRICHGDSWVPALRIDLIMLILQKNKIKNHSILEIFILYYNFPPHIFRRKILFYFLMDISDFLTGKNLFTIFLKGPGTNSVSSCPCPSVFYFGFFFLCSVGFSVRHRQAIFVFGRIRLCWMRTDHMP